MAVGQILTLFLIGLLSGRAAPQSDPCTSPGWLTKVEETNDEVLLLQKTIQIDSATQPRSNVNGPHVNVFERGIVAVEIEKSEHNSHPHHTGGHSSSASTKTNNDGGGTLPLQTAAHGSHGYLALVFLCGCLVIGSIILILQERFIQSVPYTCLLFLAGFLMAVVHHYKPRYSWLTWGAWYTSVDMWQAIDPHLIFYVFLPVLIFGDGFKLDVHLVRNKLWQVLLLAGPGVVIGVVATGVFTHVLLPYGWSWPMCFLFGSILSATDPVAVVSLFGSLGVSEELTMLVSGESLLNDGTAIVAFSLALKCVNGVKITLWSGLGFFLEMTVVPIILGCFLSALAVSAVSICSKGQGHSDAFIQVIITMCVGYFCFFFAEYELHTSGVLTLVCTSIFMSQSVWPMFVSREVIHVVWETMEFIANTVIFSLAGLILGGACLSSQHFISAADFGYLLIFYVAMTLIRGAMVLCMWKPLKMLGSDVTWKHVVVMVWAGLRGAISLTMALIVDTNPLIDKQTGAKVIFYVGGIAALTILVNAVTCGPLLRVLGMTAEGQFTKDKLSLYESCMVKHAIADYSSARFSNDLRFKGVRDDLVKEMLPALKQTSAIGASPIKKATAIDGIPLYRKMFLEMVKHCYLEDVEASIIPPDVAQKLIDSASRGQLHLERLPDWESVLETKPASAMVEKIGRRVDCLGIYPSKKELRLQQVYACLSFQEAHRKTTEEMLRQNFADIAAVQAVITEASARRQIAADYLSQQSPADVEMAKAKMMARHLINGQKAKVKHLENQGILSEHEVQKFCHHWNEIKSEIEGDRVPKAAALLLKN